LGRHQPGASAANRAHRAAGEDELPRVDPARFIGRVAKAFQTAQERGGTLQLRLNPPELGSLRLELTVKEGVMTAALETETTAARRILLDHLPALRERLAEQNIRVERFDVDVRREGNGGQADGRAAQQEQHNRQPDQAPPRRESAEQQRTAKATALELPVIRNPINDTQINLVA
jgi:flagellar hook-length control protein FliK